MVDPEGFSVLNSLSLVFYQNRLFGQFGTTPPLLITSNIYMFDIQIYYNSACIMYQYSHKVFAYSHI